MNHDVFISYSSKDQKVVEALSHYLEERGIRCFVAYRDIPLGKVWATVITEAIENCQMMVVVFSKDFNISEQVDREIELCAEEKKPILTFRIQDESFKGAKKYYLKNLNWIDAFPNPKEYFHSLSESIGKLLNIDIRHSNDIVTIENSKTGKKIEVTTQIGQQRIYIREAQAIIDANNQSFTNFSEMINSVSFDMIAIKGGPFQMGSNDSDIEKPIHSVSVSDFYIGKTVVNQALWRVVMGNNPSKWKGDKLPVELISWNDAQEFIKKLNSLTRKNYRLPTEAEWEYAAGGGATGRTRWAGTSDESRLGNYAWYGSNSYGQTHPVGTKNPNILGLCDMSGNVYEWCSDWFGKYAIDSQTNPIGHLSGFNARLNQANPIGSATGSRRVLRGGGWGSYPAGCRASRRDGNIPDYRSDYLGFRVVLPKNF